MKLLFVLPFLAFSSTVAIEAHAAAARLRSAAAIESASQIWAVAEQQKPLEIVLRSIRQRVPGRALDARLIERDGRSAYRIKWMGQNGKVHDIVADAVSGQIMKMR
jgi:uncharacterized membrane protein YkoI